MPKKSKKKVAKRKSSKKRKTTAGGPKLASLVKRPMKALLSLQAKTVRAMELKVKKGVKGRRDQDVGILAGLISGPRRPTKADREINAAQEVLSKFSSEKLSRLASRAGD